MNTSNFYESNKSTKIYLKFQICIQFQLVKLAERDPKEAIYHTYGETNQRFSSWGYI